MRVVVHNAGANFTSKAKRLLHLRNDAGVHFFGMMIEDSVNNFLAGGESNNYQHNDYAGKQVVHLFHNDGLYVSQITLSVIGKPEETFNGSF